MGRGSGSVRRRQLASAITPHSGCDRHLLNLRPPLCRCSRCSAGLRSSVRTCLTPPPTVLPTPCTFLPCRTLGGHGRRPSNNSTALDQGKICPAAPSMSYLIRREALCAQQSSPRRQLAPQDADTPWAQSKDTLGRRPRPTPRSIALGDREDQLFSPGLGGEETTHTYPTRVTLPSLDYKRRRKAPAHETLSLARTLQHPDEPTLAHTQTLTLAHKGPGSFHPSLAQACIPYYKHFSASNTVLSPLLDVWPHWPEPG